MEKSLESPVARDGLLPKGIMKDLESEIYNRDTANLAWSPGAIIVGDYDRQAKRRNVIETPYSHESIPFCFLGLLNGLFAMPFFLNPKNSALDWIPAALFAAGTTFSAYGIYSISRNSRLVRKKVLEEHGIPLRLYQESLRYYRRLDRSTSSQAS